LYYTFAGGLLTNINWGDTTFPNVVKLDHTFRSIAIQYMSISHLQVTSFGESVFASADCISVELPPNITEFGRYTFNYCYELQQITIPSKVTNIGTYAFGDCKKLSEIVSLPKVAPNVASYAFSGAGREVVGEKILYVPADATGYNEGLWLELQNTNGFTISYTL
jgi:hypothetical protein